MKPSEHLLTAKYKKCVGSAICMFMTFVKNALRFSLWMIQTSITVLQPVVMGEFQKLLFFIIIFVSFPQKRNGIVFSAGVNYLRSD